MEKLGELEAETFKPGGIQVDQGNYFKPFKDRLYTKTPQPESLTDGQELGDSKKRIYFPDRKLYLPKKGQTRSRGW